MPLSVPEVTEALAYRRARWLNEDSDYDSLPGLREKLHGQLWNNCENIAARDEEILRRGGHSAGAFWPPEEAIDTLGRRNSQLIRQYIQKQCDRYATILHFNRYLEVIEDASRFSGSTDYPIWGLLDRLDYRRYTPDYAGYCRYLSDVDPDFMAFLNEGIPVYLPLRPARHCYVTAGSGSGKTELLKVLVHGYMGDPDGGAVVILDPHGEVAEQVARWQEFAHNDRLVYIDPALDEVFKPTLNPLQLPEGASLDVVAQQLLDAFEQILAGSGGSTEISNNMRALLMPSFSVLLAQQGKTLFDLYRAFNGSDADLIAAGCKSSNFIVKDFFENAFSEKRFSGTKGSIATKLYSILSTDAQRALFVGQTTFDLGKLIEQRKIIVFNLSIGRIGATAAECFGRFVMASLQGLAMRRAAEPEKKHVPIHLLIDECQNFIAPSVVRMMTETRKYGLHLTLVQQQLGFNMDYDTRRAVLGNSTLKFTGRNNDIKTLQDIHAITGVELDELQSLDVGQFSVKVDPHKPFTVKVSGHLVGNANAMSAEEWERVKADQLRRYYRDSRAIATAPAGGRTRPPVDLA